MSRNTGYLSTIARFQIAVLVRLSATAALACALFVCPRIALADEALTCNDAYTETQRAWRAGMLQRARARALRCAQDSCSQTVRRDCVDWLERIEHAIPSVIIDARDPDLHDLADVRVELDGEPLAERLDGKPLSVDPGPHLFRFSHQRERIELSVIVREAEKYRVLRVHFAVGDAQRPPKAETAGKALPPETYALGAAGIAAVSTFAALATSAYVSEQRLRHGCGVRGTCKESDVQSVRTRYLVADLALGTGTVMLAGAALRWVFSGPPQRARSERLKPPPRSEPLKPTLSSKPPKPTTPSRPTARRSRNQLGWGVEAGEHGARITASLSF